MGLFDDTIGAVFISCTVSAILYGVTLMQSLTYFQRFPDDRNLIKYMVASLLVLDTVHMIFATHSIYIYVITNFSNVAALVEIPWSLSALVIATDIQDTAVRMFFIYRIWLLSGRNYLITVPLIISVTLLFVDEFAFFVKTCIFSFVDQVQAISWLLYAGFGLSVFVDTFIAGLLSYLLLKSRSGIRKTASLIHTLTLYTINTGVIISIASLCILTTYATMPHNYIFLACFLPLSKLFVNSFLATLNFRTKLRESTLCNDLQSFSLSKLQASSGGTGISGTWQSDAAKVSSNDTDVLASKIKSIQVQKEIFRDTLSSIELTSNFGRRSLEETV